MALVGLGTASPQEMPSRAVVLAPSVSWCGNTAFVPNLFRRRCPQHDFGLMHTVLAYNLCARTGWVWCDIGLLRLLLKLFAPQRPRYRYQQSTDSYRPVSLPVQAVQPAPWEPLRQVEEQTGQQIIRGHRGHRSQHVA